MKKCMEEKERFVHFLSAHLEAFSKACLECKHGLITSKKRYI